MTRSVPPSAYDDDFFAWTQEQASALRQLPAAFVGERLDIENLAAEIEDLGRRDLREVNSLLGRLFEHLIKIEAAGDAWAVPHWRSESRHFRRAALKAYTPSMRQLLDIAAIWRSSKDAASEDLEDMGIRPSAPVECPFTLDEMLSGTFDLDAAVARIAHRKSGLSASTDL